MPGDAVFEGRNLVVCCDGTGNAWGSSHDTNAPIAGQWFPRSATNPAFLQFDGSGTWTGSVDVTTALRGNERVVVARVHVLRPV